jgi:hypothetical protein
MHRCSVIFIHKEKRNYVMCRKLDGARDLHVKQYEQVSGRQMLHVLYNKHNLELYMNV